MNAGSATPHGGGSRILLVCSSGGHLAQLLRLRPWWEHHERVWVTFETPDATSKLAAERLIAGYWPTTRNIPNLVRNLGLAWRVIRSERPDAIVTNGAGLGVPFVWLGRLFGIPTVFQEVVDRVASRTMTGRLCAPVADLMLVQWEAQRPFYRGAVVTGPLYDLEGGGRLEGGGPAGSASDGPPADDPPRGGSPLHVLATVGTDRHPFDRLVRYLDDWGGAHAGSKVVVQYGTSTPPTTVEGHELLPTAALAALFNTVDVVVAAGGPGTLLEARAAGRVPIAVPRRHDLGEHVDDHQRAFVEHLGRLGLVHPALDGDSLVSLLERAERERGAFRCPPVPLGDTPGVARTGELIDGLVVDTAARRGLLGRWRGR